MMIVTYNCILPEVTPIGVLDEIPPEAWEPAISAAEREFGVRLDIRRHARPGEVAHYHFDVSGEEDEFPAVVPHIARLLAPILASHTKRVTLPEGR